MDREMFPTLEAGITGWPLLRVPWYHDADVVVEVSEDNDVGSIPVIAITTPIRVSGVRVFVNGIRWTADA